MRLLIGITGLFLIAGLVFSTGSFRSYAVANPSSGLTKGTGSHNPALENYDIRKDKNASDKLASMRGRLNRNAAEVANVTDRFAVGEAALKAKVPSLKVEYNPTSRVPEVITPGKQLGRSFLAGQTGRSRAESLRSFAKENSDLIGISSPVADQLTVAADYSNPEDSLAFTRLEQRINGIPVFNGEIRAGFTKDGELIRVINNLAAGVDETLAPQNFGDPAAAVKAAAQNINRSLTSSDLARRSGPLKAATDNIAEFGENEWGPTAEKIYFPTEPGVVVPEDEKLIGW